MNKPLITVIVPIYNVEKYLDKCIQSILVQTYEKLEIILVNDGSTDNCALVCEKYKRMDNRVQVIHKNNGGLSDARNVALDIMTGDYVTFVDSDDYISSDMIERLYSLLAKNDADVSCVSFIKVFDEKRVQKRVDAVRITEYTGLEAMEQIMYKKNINPSAWAKLYKKSVFEEIRYPYGKLFEDLATTYKLFYKQRKIVVSNEKMYFYLQRKDSIMYQKFQKNRFHRIDATKEMMEWCEQNEPSLREAAQVRFFLANIQVLREMPIKKEWKSELEEIQKNIKENRKTVVKCKQANKIDRIIAGSTYLGVYPLKIMGVIYKLVWP